MPRKKDKPHPQDNAALHSPIAAERVAAEIEAFKNAFEGLDIMHVEHGRYTKAGTPAGRTSPPRAFFTPLTSKLKQDILSSLNAVDGTFSPDKQAFIDWERVVAEGAPHSRQELNEVLADHIASLLEHPLAFPHATHGSSIPLDFEMADGQNHRVCSVVLTPHVIQEAEFLDAFASRNAHIDISLADIYQFVANHELVHCVNVERGLPAWLDESLSDAYAIARHIQLNGDDGFAEVILSSRQLSFDTNGAQKHYTVPALERLLPKLKKAYAANKLEGLTPEQLRDYTVSALLGEDEQQANSAVQELEQEILGALDIFTQKATALSVDGADHIVAHDGLTPPVKQHAALYAERQNRALEVFQQSPEILANSPRNTSTALRAFRVNIDEYIAMQPDIGTAIEGIQYQLWRMHSAERNVRQLGGEEAVQELYASVTPEGITFRDAQRVLQGYNDALELEKNTKESDTIG